MSMAKTVVLSFLDLHSLLPTVEGVGTFGMLALDQTPCKGNL